MKKTALPLIFLLLCIIGSAFAYPRLSVEKSTTCNSCHINPTGGGMRNEFANYTVSLNEFCLPSTKQTSIENYKKPRLSESIVVGFDSRHLLLEDGSVFRMQTDFHLSFEPFKNFQYVFRFWENGINENYAIASMFKEQFYLRAGRFNPAFGLKNVDHTAYNRVRTGHGSNIYLDGVGITLVKNNFQFTAEAFSQNDQGIYGLHAMKSMEFKNIGLFLGASYRLSEELLGTNRLFPHAKAIFGGASYDRFTFMGELDLVGQGNDTLISYMNLTTRLEYGLYLITEYNFFDGNRDVADGADEFLRFSVELYPISFVQLRPSYTRYTDGALKDESMYFLQLHFGY